MERLTLFADLLLPLPLPAYFTYRVPYELNTAIQVGQRVVVQFGKKKVYTALVRKIHQVPPQYSDIKYILSILENELLWQTMSKNGRRAFLTEYNWEAMEKRLFTCYEQLERAACGESQ